MGDTTYLEVILQLKDEATAGMKKFTDSFAEAEKQSKYFAVGVAAVAVGAVAFGVSTIKAAGESEAALASMSATLDTMGAKGTNAKASILKMADATTKLGFDDEDAAQSIAKLFQRTGDLTQAQNLNNLAMDLSRAKHIDLLTASNLVGLVMSGNGKILKQYGIDLKDNATPLEALGELSGKVGGQSKAFANTWEGQMAIMAVATQNFREEIGKYLLPILTNLLKNVITPFLQKSIEWASNVKNLTNFFKDHQAILVIVAGAIAGALVPAFWAWATAAGAAAVAMIAALWPFALAGALIAGLVAAIVWVVQNWEMIKQKATEIWGAILNYLSEVWDKIKNTASGVWNLIADYFKGLWDKIQGIFNFGLALITGLMITFLDWIMPNWRGNFDKLKTFISESWESIKFIFKTAADAIKFVWETVWTAIANFLAPRIQFISDSISASLTWIKDTFTAIAGPIKDAWGAIWDGVKELAVSAWSGIQDVVKDSINWIIDKINWFVKAANSTAIKGAGALGISIPHLSEIPRLAMGGIVTRPTIAMIGEAGPEAIIPLSGSAGQSMRPQVNNIYITGNTLLDSRAAEKMGDLIVRRLGLNVKV